ncbi:unnamed protein product [Linum trigynum]|uniref:Uncharacterized protein n=1 Tax=Linum trigynum TaxID=586398 RepID=A0AAV2F589_9ROSI
MAGGVLGRRFCPPIPCASNQRKGGKERELLSVRKLQGREKRSSGRTDGKGAAMASAGIGEDHAGSGNGGVWELA